MTAIQQKKIIAQFHSEHRWENPKCVSKSNLMVCFKNGYSQIYFTQGI